MRNYYFFLILMFGLKVSAQTLAIADPAFKAKLVSQTYVSKNIIGQFAIIDTNHDGEIQTAEAYQVSELYVDDANIQSLAGINGFTNLVAVTCANNQLTSINGADIPLLQRLDCQNNQLQSLQLSGLYWLEEVYCDYNMITDLNINNSLNIKYLGCSFNALTSINLAGMTKLKQIKCTDNQLSQVNLDGLVRLSSAEFDNNLISAISINNTPLLQVLTLNNNSLTAVDFSASPGITYLGISDNPITSLNIGMLTSLYRLDCENNHLATIDLYPFPNLIFFLCKGNEFTSLDFSGNPNLQTLDCSDNPITALDFSGLPLLYRVIINNTLVTSLDFTENTVSMLTCASNNQLQSIFLKNGYPEAVVDINNNSNLQYICADESEIQALQQIIASGNQPNCAISSYCTFGPGGITYLINGTVKYDSNNNGCDVSDYPYAYAKLILSVGNVPTTIVANALGIFSIPVSYGVYTITPVLEYPNLFTVSPAQVNVDFSSQPSPFNINFCVTTLQNVQDVAVNLLPLGQAQPGFEIPYKLVYKNKGSQSVSGTIGLNYQSDILHYIASTVPPTNQTTANLSWDYQNLLPFETRQVLLTLRLNGPADVPAVTEGELFYSATISPLETDFQPDDNTSVVSQVIVNSYDPNDKTCLEGDKITPEMVGKDVHYIIRFENTGTANARNIVIKDMIDSTKFDVGSLVPISSSHPFVTKISNTNKVEFIFENINLPFDDADNDGYIAFKIKTKPNLVLGDTFSNTASIYFDYNFPIVTNNATTTIALLRNQDFEFADSFKCHPNPVKDVLNIESVNSIEVNSINIYNTLGQLVLIVPNAQETKSVNVSGLKSGNYFVKINSDKGSATAKFVKL